jgi:hypothetical protein
LAVPPEAQFEQLAAELAEPAPDGRVLVIHHLPICQRAAGGRANLVPGRRGRPVAGYGTVLARKSRGS